MADEITIRSNMQIVKAGLNYQNKGGDFTKDLTNPKGPSPGGFEASVTGTLVDITALESYGACIIKNYDATNKVEFGLYVSAVFYPLTEIGPSEEYIYYFSENLGEQYGTAGTGTTGPAILDFLMIRAITASCNVSVEAFER